MYTTLEQIREHTPCEDGWKKLLSSLGKTKADSESLKLSRVLESNGLEDTLWCFRAIAGYDREKRLYAVWCAKQVEHLMTDKRSLEALDITQAYAEGKASKQELKTASDAAWDAARAAWAAARAAARAASDAAWAARAAQEAELRRMLICVEAGETYNI